MGAWTQTREPPGLLCLINPSWTWFCFRWSAHGRRVLYFCTEFCLRSERPRFLFHNLFCCHLRLHSGFHTSSLLQSYHKCFIPVFLRLSLDYHQYCGAIVAASGSLLVCLSRSAWSKSGLAACSIFFDMLIPLGPLNAGQENLESPVYCAY